MLNKLAFKTPKKDFFKVVKAIREYDLDKNPNKKCC